LRKIQIQTVQKSLKTCPDIGDIPPQNEKTGKQAVKSMKNI
jgi:hypothetical protein